PCSTHNHLLSLHDALPIFLAGQAAARLRHDHRLDGLAAIGIADADHGAFGDVGMAVDRRLDHAGVDLEAAGVECAVIGVGDPYRSEEHTSELQSRFDLVCR